MIELDESSELVIKRYASEIVKDVMMSVVMEVHPDKITDTIAARIIGMMEKLDEVSE